MHHLLYRPFVDLFAVVDEGDEERRKVIILMSHLTMIPRTPIDHLSSTIRGTITITFHLVHLVLRCQSVPSSINLD